MGQVKPDHEGFAGNGIIMADAYRKPIGYEQISGLSSAKGLTTAKYEGASYALIQADTQNVRWRDDGSAPTSSIGMQLSAGQQIAYFGDLASIKFIEETSSAKLNVSYYRL